VSTFRLGERDFLLDGEPFRILSGALHYFRVYPAYWADRIHKARLLGLNTIETYVAWNAHEPFRGEWSWDDGLDLGRFLDLVAAEKMHAIVRPGPYICAEWDNGGLPGWLSADPDVGVRRSEPRYLAEVTRYLQRVHEVVAPRQIERGGPVVLVQIENEYGAYSDDADYLRTLVEVTRRAGITVPLTTVDQPQDDMLAAGSLPELHRTASFGSRSRERLATLRRHQPGGPLMVMEYWDGWFDDWAGPHHVTDAGEAARDLDDLLSTGASVNLYMFHGGTNFGFTSGANHHESYAPIVTSYDYDAPLDEAGDPTAKYWAFREVIASYTEIPEERPAPPHPAPALTGSFDQVADLALVAERLGHWTRHEDPPTMDALGRFRGLTYYRTRVDPVRPARLELGEVRDRALAFVDGAPVGSWTRGDACAIDLAPGSAEMTLLVEDLGRVDYGPLIGEPKGVIGPARLEGRIHGGWEALPVRLELFDELLEAVGFVATGGKATPFGVPVFRIGTIVVDEPADLFLDTAGWGKGSVWINGFALGRFWHVGPQRTLYVPAPILRPGANQVLVLELEPGPGPALRTVPHPVLGGTAPVNHA